MDERELIQAGYRYALSLAHSPQDAEDLVQAASVKLYERQGALGNRPLFLTTIRNLFYDGWRRGKVVAFRSMDSEPSGEPSTADPSPGIRRDLLYFLGKLRPEEREAIYLNVVEGYTAEEIARWTDRPRNTVLSHLHRARKRLASAAAEETQRLPAEGG
ncbi:MAG: RNA polymerase sigma factor [Acidobacteriota bacterium]